MAERLRAALPADCEALAAIDAPGNPSAWSAAAFAETLARAHGLVAEDARGDVAGFIVFALVADECEILAVAVSAAHRRRGIGRALLQAAFAVAGGTGARRCFLEVRASNVAAQALYAGCGFALDGRRRDYYRDGADGREDALLLSRDLDGACA